MTTQEIKKATTTYDVDANITKRFSPRAFSDKMISQEQLNEMFEAASWAASTFNSQPWRYHYAFRGTPGFDDLWNCLVAQNQPWSKDASVLMVAFAQITNPESYETNNWAEHDLGMANAHMMLQGVSKNVYGHMMAGFDPIKVQQVTNHASHLKPVCLIALGYLGEVNNLEEPYKSREMNPRIRNVVEQFTTKL